jgi:tetratricopeptide (TPR) repeat protein
LQGAGRAEEAAPMVAEAAKLDPNNPGLISLQASLLEAQGKYDDAEAAYKRAIELDPKLFDGYYNIGVLYNNRAATEYEKCKDIKDDGAYEKCKKAADAIIAKALPYFEQAHTINPDDKACISSLKTLYAKMGNTEKFNEMKKLLGE